MKFKTFYCLASFFLCHFVWAQVSLDGEKKQQFDFESSELAEAELVGHKGTFKIVGVDSKKITVVNKKLSENKKCNSPPEFKNSKIRIGSAEMQAQLCQMDYEIFIPKAMRLTVKFSQFNSIIENINGFVRIDAEAGDLKFVNSSGRVLVSLKTGDATFEKTAPQGRIELSEKGIVRLNLQELPKSGNIDIFIKTGQVIGALTFGGDSAQSSYQIQTQVVSGSVIMKRSAK